MHCAADMGNVEMVMGLLNAGAAVGAVAGDGSTPLHLAVRSGSGFGRRSGAVFAALVAAGAPVNGANERGWLPLHSAISERDVVVFEILLAAGAIL